MESVADDAVGGLESASFDGCVVLVAEEKSTLRAIASACDEASDSCVETPVACLLGT